jgi:hypothetical protein
MWRKGGKGRRKKTSLFSSMWGFFGLLCRRLFHHTRQYTHKNIFRQKLHETAKYIQSTVNQKQSLYYTTPVLQK